MPWPDNLRPASFRGVPFKVETVAQGGGRRAAVHEFPYRDTPLVEELGRQARRYQVEGYVLGDDYDLQRQRLVSALERASVGYPSRPGGTLVHPVIGQVLVLCVNFEVRETVTREGRISRFSMEFVEAGRELQPVAGVDPAGGADVASAAVYAQAQASYAAEVETAGVVAEALDAIEDVVREADRRLRRLDVFSGPTRSVRALEDALNVLVGTVSELVTAPADLAAQAATSLDAVLASAGTHAGALEAYRALFDLEPLDVPGEGSQAASIRTNSAAVVGLFRGLAAGGAVRAAARLEWATLDEAQAARAELEGLLDELEAGTDDALNLVLGGLRLALQAAVPPPGEDLPEVTTYALATTLPALVIAHRLYQDPGRAEELVARNHEPNPLRVPGGRQLQVLSR